MQKHFALYPIVGVNRDLLEDPFDTSVLPVQIVPGVTIEDARKLFPEDSFKLWWDNWRSGNSNLCSEFDLS